PAAYLFQIARNEVARAGVKQQRREQPLAEELCANHEDSCDRGADAGAAIAALARLDAMDRELVELKLFAGLTFREIAQLSGQPPGTVATRYRRALEFLRGWLEQQFR
ncbi:MAG: hypothetical protein H0T51_04435, partial [Pirellulales bacterium]|nr:hypothetical protein [Pirellulales bacterium]